MSQNEDIKYDSYLAKHEELVPWKLSDVIFTYFFIFALAVFSVGLLIFTGLNTGTGLFAAALQIILSLTTIFVVYYVVRHKYNLSFSRVFGISVKKLPVSAWQGFAVSMCIVISTTLISFLFTQFVGAPKGNPYVDMPSEKLKIISLLAIFIAPVVEEIFFRGFMQPAMVKSFGAFGGIFITALVFGLSHTQYFDYSAALVAVIVIGIILGTTRYYTGSVMPGIFAHLLNNFYAAWSLLGH